MQVATATTTTVLLGLAKEFSASSAQSSATKGNIMHLIIRREKRVLIWKMFIFKGKKYKNIHSAALDTFKNPATYGRRFLVQL